MSGRSSGGLIGRLADDFDMAWRASPPAQIEEFYRRVLSGEARVLDEAGRLTLLEELIKLDLEYRWRSSTSGSAGWRIHDYVQRFVELRGAGWNPTRLLCEEFRARWQWGDRPSRQSFAREYPQVETSITPLLFKIEQSLHGQIANPPSLYRTGSFVPRQEDAKSTDSSAAPPANSEAARFAIPGYEIKGELGRGGMGVVYKAWDPRLKRLVALKIIISGAHAGDEEMTRFKKEAQAVAKLKHANVVQIYSLGEHNNRPFFALEYVHGGSLSRYLRGSPQPPRIAAEFVATLARAMAVAHKEGIVHRDLKPANVLLDIDRPGQEPASRAFTGPQLAGCRPKIADFGLAKQLGDDSGQTRTGAIVGTPSYMSPEQAEGRTKDVGPACDIYALGAILYEMLVGRPPFQGATLVETLDLVRGQEPVSPRLLQPAVPRDLDTICLKCLAKDPDQRYRTATDLADDLQRFCVGEPILARPVGAVEQAWKFYRRHPRVVYTGAGVVLLLLLLVAASGVLALLSASRTKAISAQATAEGEKLIAQRDKDAAELAKVTVERDKKSVELAAAQKERSQQYDLLVGVSERELHSKGDVALAEKKLDECPQELRGWEWNYLVRLCDGGHEPLTGHEAGLWSIAFHPTNSQEIATASIDGTVRLWNVSSRSSTVLDAHRIGLDKVTNAAKAVDSVKSAAGISQVKDTVDNLMSIVSGGNREIQKIVPIPVLPNLPSTRGIPEHLTPVLRVAYSPDGAYVASGGLDPNVTLETLTGANHEVNPVGTVIVWDRSRNTWKSFAKHKFIITALAFSPDGKHIASAGLDDDHSWKLWDRETGEVSHTFLGHKGWVSQARFSPDGKYVATGSTDGTAILWDLSTHQAKYTFVHHHATVHDIAFSFTKLGNFLATAGMDGNVFIWNLDLPEPWREPAQRLSGHIGSALGVAFSPDGTRVASGGFDRTVRLWDPKTGAEKITLRGHTDCVWSVAFSADGRRLASASFDGTARIWDASPTEDQSFPGNFTIRNEVGTQEKRDEDHRVNRLVFSSDGQRLVTASWDRTAGVWDAKTGAKILQLNHDGPVWGVAITPKNDRIVSGSWDTTVRLWDAVTGKKVTRRNTSTGASEPWFGRLKSPVQSVAMSHNGRLVVAGGWDGTIQAWEVDSGKEAFTRRAHYLPVFGMAFSPDDRYLATASGDRTAKLWPIGGGEEIPLLGHTATVYSVAFDKTGHRIATASWDRSVGLWQFADGHVKLERQLNDAKDGHKDYVYGLAFSPNGRRLATVSNDKTLRYWDTETGRRVGEVRTLRGVAWDVAYHPDGDRLATAIWNPKCWVKVWPAKP